MERKRKSMSKKTKWTLTVNTDQAYLLQNAVELMARLLAGQVDEIRSTVVFRHHVDDPNYPDNEKIDKALADLKAGLFPELHRNASYGVGSKDVSPDSHRLWDLYQVIRRPLYLDRVKDSRERNLCVLGDSFMKTSDLEPAVFTKLQTKKGKV